jgi:hypothetical protein
MRSKITENFSHDSDGNPTGGDTHGCGFHIRWQDGPLNVNGERSEPNGAFVETVIAACAGRIDFYQHSKFNSPHNAKALLHLGLALEALDNRTRDRERRGVEGTHQV